MQNPLSYFTSLSGFNNLIAGLSRRLHESYYRLFIKQFKIKLRVAIEKYIPFDHYREKLKNIIKIPLYVKKNISDKETNGILKEADEILEGYIDLLGSGKIKLDPVDWHMDFKTGYSWPKGKFFRDYDQEMIGVNSDVKVPRELSRSHHILKVAVAYSLSGDERYASFCVHQMSNWIDENPLMFSINWGCTMDVAIRAVNWIHILRLISDSENLTDKLYLKSLNSLYEHGWYIYRNPEKAPYNNHNHYLADLSGQIYLGLLFYDLEEPKKWLKEGKIEFFNEIRLQILPTGMSYERSTNYNRLVLELILGPVLLLKQNKHEIPSDIWYRIEMMFDFIMHSLKPDGKSTVIGDQDNGRLLPFGNEELLDYSYLLSIGSVLFNRVDFKNYSNGYNIYTALLGPENSKEIFDSLVDVEMDLESIGFKDTGLYIMRKNDNYLLFNITGKGKYPELPGGTHTHSDLLSFELFTHGKTFLLDPGSYVYTSDLKQRMYFRSTQMHNTVTIDGFSQNNLKEEEPWGFNRNALPELLKWETNKEFDQIVACHTGYLRLDDPVKHTRSVIFDKTKEKWLIEDILDGNDTHLVAWYFHLDKGIDFEIFENTITTTCTDGKNIQMVFEKKDGLRFYKEYSYISKSYGLKYDALTLMAEIKVKLPLSLRIELKKINT